MEPKRALTLMVFPQRYANDVLRVNLVVIPRNIDPFKPFLTGLANPSSVPGFANLQPNFELRLVKGSDDFPLDNAVGNRKPIPLQVNWTAVPMKAEMLKMVEQQMPVPVTDTNDKPPTAIPAAKAGNSIRKYLPESYRKSFNFTRPLHPNAVVDDSYECAMRDKAPTPPYQPRTSLSWGRVFAHILRQPLLATACGMIYQTEVTIPAADLEEGGYLYAELVNEPWRTAQKQLLDLPDGPLVKRYAAKLPAMQPGQNRPVFAPILFPVLHKPPMGVEPEPRGPWDEVFKEVYNYSDGFARIVHANQPISGNLLAERADGLHPQKESGIRLGWDDEQILVWYLRQLLENQADAGSNKPLDAPLGVFGFAIDVREQIPDAVWESLNRVTLGQPDDEGTQKVINQLTDAETEQPYQVYPNKITGPTASRYWLPMYFAKWLGNNMTLSDDDAMAIYKNDEAGKAGFTDGESRKATANKALAALPVATQLSYGHTYQFRVRMKDISGGGPQITDEPLLAGPSPATTVTFRRFVAPNALDINLPEGQTNNKQQYFNELGDNSWELKPMLVVGRPGIEYPAVIFTRKYDDPVSLLKNQLPDANGQLTPMLPDPDTNRFELLVEVETLRMDQAASRGGDENYFPLYRTVRQFDAGDFFAQKQVPIEFIDVPVLNLGSLTNPFLRDDLQQAEIDAMEALPLPTGRQIRISLRAVADSGNQQEEAYFGTISPGKPEADSRYGKETRILFYHPPLQEDDLLRPYRNIPVLQGIFLKPDAIELRRSDDISAFMRRETTDSLPDVVARLAAALGVAAKGLTLVAPKGERIAFGCSSNIRHTLAPDGSSITFAGKSELQNHWLACLSLQLHRDWAYDALEDTAFVIRRSTAFRNEMATHGPTKQDYLGDIELKHTASFESLQTDRFGVVNRGFTRLIYLDALEPKSRRKRNDGSGEMAFPDELNATYAVIPRHKTGHPQGQPLVPDSLILPTVIPPAQVPKISSVGLAFSPYLRSADYSSSEARRRYLWVEFDEPVENPDDTIFCRVLAVAPDQLLSHNNSDLMGSAPLEPALPIDPEHTRIIIPGQSDDKAGIGAMQPMIKATDSNRHYLLPTPPGMHPESAELFGFFTYEFRIGHGHWPDRDDNLWSTAQARFGRPLRVTGMQHPVPTLFCQVNRNEQFLSVSAPFARAVFNGQNVTSRPPRTTLWAMLYAQVHQADGKDFRNILIGEKQLEQALGIYMEPKRRKESQELLVASLKPPKPIQVTAGGLSVSTAQIVAGTKLALKKQLQPTGSAVFTNLEIATFLRRFGLPEDASLSVVVVEVFGNITNARDHINFLRWFDSGARATSPMQDEILRASAAGFDGLDHATFSKPKGSLNNQLGQFRILRTSPLTKVPFVCCPTCEK